MHVVLKNLNFTLLLSAFLLMAMPLHSVRAQSSGIQMLPPTNVGTITPCTPGSNYALVLNDDATTAGDSAINCNSGLVVTTTGSVGIGTTNPAATLEVNGSTLLGNYVGIGAKNDGIAILEIANDGSAPANTSVYIGDNPVGYSLILSTIYARQYVNGHSYLIDGACYAGSCTSDIRVKDHIRLFKPGLDALLAINPIYYRLTGQGGTMKSDHDLLGVTAQDVEKGAPELITQAEVKMNPGDREETEIKKVDYTGLSYITINAVKELYAKWAGDHETLAALKTDNDDLRARLDAEDKSIDALMKAKTSTASSDSR